ncbi:hypothetical protein [Spartinivicinus poritis]|uniref:Uncharacterized protein n=1 Tax=Spartinivicinus poritis TaxID=2994640 RepID=A0ABT5UAK8_9GAMM|nr:hypothetical protein [Spartinivicinus sp. A2-2]MDE1462164.1 hypothetical protein [Spartinivicinus sp. A2-2]
MTTELPHTTEQAEQERLTEIPDAAKSSGEAHAEQLKQAAANSLAKLKQQEQQKLTNILNQLKQTLANSTSAPSFNYKSDHDSFFSNDITSNMEAVPLNSKTANTNILGGLQLKDGLLPPLQGMNKIQKCHQTHLIEYLEQMNTNLETEENTHINKEAP